MYGTAYHPTLSTSAHFGHLSDYLILFPGTHSVVIHHLWH